MRNLKLSENFRLSEFTRTEPTDYQLSLLKILAGELQIVRDELQAYKSGTKPVSIMIASGVRTKADIERLKKQGYNPSENSDHLFGVQVNGIPTLGAADIQVKNCSLNPKKIALFIKELILSYKVNFGQVIYEKNPATGAEWIHLGNDPELIFKPAIKVSRKKFLMSLDNGKTYKALK